MQYSLHDTSNTNIFDCNMYIRLSSPADRFQTVGKAETTSTPYYGKITDETTTTMDSDITTDAITTLNYGNMTDGTSTTLDSDITTNDHGIILYIMSLAVCMVIVLITLALLTMWVRGRKKGKCQFRLQNRLI